MEDKYWLAGKASVPEDKKQEFNECVMEVLDRCGIRKRKEITLSGKSVTVLEKPQADENGMVSFDYSIFEKKNRQTSTYDTNTCELQTVDRGVGEFGLAMNLILLLQECYSDGKCVFMVNRRPVYVDVYMRMLSTILNRKIYNYGREKAWDILLLLRESPDADMPSIRDIIILMFVYGFNRWNDFQMGSVLATYNSDIPKTEKDSITDRRQIPEALNMPRMEYLYGIMSEEYQKDRQGLTGFLEKLIVLSLPEREKLADEDNNAGIMAELSLYMAPACFINILAVLEKKEFWDVWDELGGKGYTGAYPSDKDDELSEEWDRHEFYAQILRENEDEFLEFWNGENLKLSDEMKERIHTWRKLVDAQLEHPNIQIEQYLIAILADMEKEWACRYADEAFVQAVLLHQGDPAWRKVVFVLRQLMDKELERFPEMDREMAVDWTKTYRTSFDTKAIAAYCSLMANDVARQRVFGF